MPATEVYRRLDRPLVPLQRDDPDAKDPVICLVNQIGFEPIDFGFHTDSTATNL